MILSAHKHVEGKFERACLLAVALAGMAMALGGCRQGATVGPPPAVEGTGGAGLPADRVAPGSNQDATARPPIIQTPELPPHLATVARPAQPSPSAERARSGIRGTVTDEQGKPLVDVAVTIVEASRVVPAMAIFTDAAGHYEWPVGPGQYTLEAARDGYKPARATVTVEAGQVAQADMQLVRQ